MAAIEEIPKSVNVWRCKSCKQLTGGRCLMKRCPECGQLDTLELVPR